MESTRQLCTFSLGGLLFGVDVRSIQEVIRHHEMTRVPTASPVVRGLINLRGQIVLVIDLGRRLGLKPRDLEADPVHVIIRTDDRPLSLLVDEVGNILDLPAEAMEPTPDTVRADIRGFLDGIYKHPGRLLLLLNVERVAEFDVGAEAA